MSNTTMKHGEKGSKYWVDILVNFKGGKLINTELYSHDKTLKDIEWLSPLASENYKEYKLNETKIEDLLNTILNVNNSAFDFWPSNQPQWDAIGKSGNTIILVEAKGHIKETKTKISASSQESIELIIKSFKETMKDLSIPNINIDVWLNEYYQLANRITFLHKLNNNSMLNYNFKLVLLNIVNDYTHKPTTAEQWDEHYEEVFRKMLGNVMPAQLINIYFNVGNQN